MSKGVVQRVAPAEDGRDGGEVGAQGRVHHVEEAVAVAVRGYAVVDAGEFHVDGGEDLVRREGKGGGTRVYGEADVLRVDVLRRGGVAGGVGPPEEDVLVGQGEVQDDVAVGGFVGVCDVAGEGVWGSEPLTV